MNNRRFTINSENFIDNETDLMWEKKSKYQNDDLKEYSNRECDSLDRR